jgi:hypothetical protein
MHRNQLLFILVLVSAAASSGCRTTQASFRGNAVAAKPAPATASFAKPSAAPSSAPLPPQTPARHPSRESEFAVYHNPDYRISFRYPRNYALVQGPQSGAPAFLQFQQDLAAEQPGAILVATVLIPEDAYPNTTFRSGSLEFVVHPGVSAEACRSYGTPSESDSPGIAGSLTIRGIPFDWRLRGRAAAGTYFENVEYAGFSGGTCYEFLIEIVESNYVEQDSGIKPADTSRILRPLEKIVLSFQQEPRL